MGNNLIEYYKHTHELRKVLSEQSQIQMKQFKELYLRQIMDIKKQVEFGIDLYNKYFNYLDGTNPSHYESIDIVIATLNDLEECLNVIKEDINNRDRFIQLLRMEI